MYQFINCNGQKHLNPVIIHFDNIKLYGGSKATDHTTKYPDQTLSADQTFETQKERSLDRGSKNFEKIPR